LINLVEKWRRVKKKEAEWVREVAADLWVTLSCGRFGGLAFGIRESWPGLLGRLHHAGGSGVLRLEVREMGNSS
jgi:hypothetical protein